MGRDDPVRVGSWVRGKQVSTCPGNYVSTLRSVEAKNLHPSHSGHQAQSVMSRDPDVQVIYFFNRDKGDKGDKGDIGDKNQVNRDKRDYRDESTPWGSVFNICTRVIRLMST